MIVEKPWGRVVTYALNQPSSVRVITVEPGQETSVHYHRMRDETWVVLDPGLTIEIGDFVGMFTDRYGDGPDAAAVLNLVWEATIAGGEPSAADDVSELRWFARDSLPADRELAFRWLALCLREWSTKAGGR